MKKSSLVVGMVFSSIFLCANEFSGYEENHLFAEPIETVQNIIDVRDDLDSVKQLSSRTQNIANKNYNALRNITSIDASKVRYTSLQCSYKDERTGNRITSIFSNKNNMWHLEKIQNPSKQHLNKLKKKDYDMYTSQYCVEDFRLAFQYAYPKSKLTLIGREALVKGIVLKKKNKIYSATFNLSHYPLNKYAQSGWHVSKINLTPIKKRVVTNKQVPSKHRGFYLKETVPYMPNVKLVHVPNENGLKLVRKERNNVIKPKASNQIHLTKLICDQKDKFIRIVFTHNTNEALRILEDKNNHKYIKFNFNSHGIKPKIGNCSFLSLKNNIINLEKFPYDIKTLEQVDIQNQKTSYIDFHYEKSFFSF